MSNKIHCEFKIKSNDTAIVIAGFANANTVDRGIERIDPKAWRLDNYKKNPIVLFDHGMDHSFGSLPIGRSKLVEAKDGGLFAEIEISNSKTEKITAVRDLIREGILKTFSVGFDPKDHTKDEGARVITDAELLEISIVPIPMNQDSTFSLLSKSLPDSCNKTARKWFSNYQKKIRAEAIKSTKKQIGCDKLVLLSVIVEKSGFKEIDTAKKQLKSNGYSVDNITENDTQWIFKQSDNHAGDSICLNLAPFVSAQVKGEKMENTEQEEKYPIEEEKKEMDKEEEEKEPEVKAEMSKEDVDASLEAMKAEAMACAANEPGNPPSWVSDETAWQKAKEAADLSYSREDPEKFYAAVTWLYQNRFGGGKKEPIMEETPKGCDKEKEVKSAPIPTGSEAVEQSTSPLLDLSKQTNVLLGALISEVQKLNQSMEKLVVKPIELGETIEEEMSESTATGEESETPQDENEDQMKSYIEKIRKNQDDLKRKLKSFE